MALARLNDSWMRKAHRPGVYWDTSHKGLGVRVTPKGTKAWIYQRSGRGGRTLGRWPDMPVPKAMLAYDAAKAMRAETKEKRAPVPTLGEAAEAKARALKLRERSPRTIELIDVVLARYVPDWTERKLDKITGADLIAVHETVGDQNGKVAANHLMRTLRAVHNHARRTCASLGEWPGKGRVQFFEEKVRDTIARDLTRWHAMLAAEVDCPRKRDLWSFVLLTGLRNEDACTLRWDELEERDGVLWAFRPNPKGGPKRAFWLPLCAHARAIVERQEKVCDWVWWNVVDGEFAHWGPLRKPRPKSKTRKKAKWKSKLPTAHDLRRTWVTAAVDAGVPFPVYQRLLNHTPTNVTFGYVRPTDAMLVRGAHATGEHIAAQTGGF